MGKKLGQHFLHSRPVLDAILAAAAPAPGEPVLEIGPGPGALTQRLLEAGANLCAMELDPELAEALRGRWGTEANFRLLEGDVLKLPLDAPALFGEDRPYAVVANLPYYLSTPLLFRMAAERTRFSRLVLMLQMEVGRRILAGPAGGKDYGSLSIAMAHAFDVSLVRRVPASAFKPPPKVASAVLAFRPRPPVLPPQEEAAFLDHVKTLFTRRRKRMASVLKAMAGGTEAWERVREAVEGLVGERRAETLTPEEHLAVFRALHPR